MKRFAGIRPGFGGLAPMLVMLLVFPHGAPGKTKTIGGFDVSNARIPVKEIRSGGPPRDGIPSIDRPRFWSVAEADRFLNDSDIVGGFVGESEARAYPLRILDWHEIVNDVVAGRPIMVTYCPLCRTAMAFSRQIGSPGSPPPTFGVSGLLYQSDVLMYDRTTESLWSQLAAEAVAGRLAGTKLKWLPTRQMTWAAWRVEFPDSIVLSTATGHSRDYANAPYQNYDRSPWPIYYVPRQRRELKQKAPIAGIVLDGIAKAYPLDRLAAATFDDDVGGARIRVTYDPKAKEFAALRSDGTSIPYTHAYWFAWQAFYPDTELWAP